MEQRIYYGPIEPDALADYLVRIFHQPTGFPYQRPHSMAQKIRQNELVYVQIMRGGEWSGPEQGALSLQIQRIAGGVRVSMGQADWLDLDQAGLAGMLFGALFFPPLLIFPMIHGLVRSTLAQDVWASIEAYCLPVRPRQAGTPPGFYCSYCGSLNHPHATRCHNCAAPFAFHAQEQEPPAPDEPASQPEPESASVSYPQDEERQVICPRCGATVSVANFCGNCAAPLRR